MFDIFRQAERLLPHQQVSVGLNRHGPGGAHPGPRRFSPETDGWRDHVSLIATPLRHRLRRNYNALIPDP